MIKIEIGKENFLTRRNNNIWDCKMDQFGTAYCPSELKNASIVSSPLPVEIKTVNHTIYDEKVANVFYVGVSYKLSGASTVVTALCGDYSNCHFSASLSSLSIGSTVVTALCGDYSNCHYKGTIQLGLNQVVTALCGDYSNCHYKGTIKAEYACPTGTVLEGSQCKGINYVCPAGYTDNGSNCKKTITYSCNSNLITPVLLDGNWKCGSLVCDGNLKCGYGTCDLPSKPSLDKYQDVAYNPLQYITNNQCNSDICDYTINAKVSYCESLQCPKGDDIIQDSGKCYKLECPAGTYLSGDKCIKSNY